LTAPTTPNRNGPSSGPFCIQSLIAASAALPVSGMRFLQLICVAYVLPGNEMRAGEII
jgi:hypothetical protein